VKETQKRLRLSGGELLSRAEINRRNDPTKKVKESVDLLSPKNLTGPVSRVRAIINSTTAYEDRIWVKVGAEIERPCMFGEEEECLDKCYEMAADKVKGELAEALEIIKRLAL